MTVTFNFSSPVKSMGLTSLTVTAPNYSVSASGSACVIPLSGGSLLKTSSAWGEGSSIAWSCESTVASGSWAQTWGDLPPISGVHVITGTWGAWTLTVDDGLFLGVADLTVHPGDAGKLLQCKSGISSLRMLGVMAFEAVA